MAQRDDGAITGGHGLEPYVTQLLEWRPLISVVCRLFQRFHSQTDPRRAYFPSPHWQAFAASLMLVKMSSLRVLPLLLLLVVSVRGMPNPDSKEFVDSAQVRLVQNSICGHGLLHFTDHSDTDNA